MVAGCTVSFFHLRDSPPCAPGVRHAPKNWGGSAHRHLRASPRRVSPGHEVRPEWNHLPNVVHTANPHAPLPFSPSAPSAPGKHVVAAVDLEAGAELIEELPLVCWPSTKTLEGGAPACARCLRILDRVERVWGLPGPLELNGLTEHWCSECVCGGGPTGGKELRPGLRCPPP